MDAPTAEAWHIEPNGPLVGDVQVSGSKNAVTKHMVAALLGDSPSHHHQRARRRRRRHHRRHPPLARRRGRHRRRHASPIDPIAGARRRACRSSSPASTASRSCCSARCSHRTHEAFVPLVGGDRIGRRPVDFHVERPPADGRRDRGAADGITARMAGRLRGTRITLPYPSRRRHRDRAALRRARRGPHRAPQRGHRARGHRAGAVPPAHGRPASRCGPTAAS